MKTVNRFALWGLFLAMVLTMVLVSVSLMADTKQKKALSADELRALWSQRANDAKKQPAHEKKEYASTAVALAGPNALVHGAPPSPPGENNNSSVSWSEVAPGEVYAVYNEFMGPGFVPALIGLAWSPAGRAPGTWVNFGPRPPVGGNTASRIPYRMESKYQLASSRRFSGRQRRLGWSTIHESERNHVYSNRRRRRSISTWNRPIDAKCRLSRCRSYMA